MARGRGKRKSSRGDLNGPPSKKGLQSSSVSGVLTTPPSTLTLGNASCANQATNLQGFTGQTKSKSSNRHTRGTVNVLAPSHENRDRDHDATRDDTQFLRRQDIPTLVQEVLKSLSLSNTDSTIATTLNVGQQDTPEATVTIHEEITIGTAVRTTTIAAQNSQSSPAHTILPVPPSAAGSSGLPASLPGIPPPPLGT